MKSDEGVSGSAVAKVSTKGSPLLCILSIHSCRKRLRRRLSYVSTLNFVLKMFVHSQSTLTGAGKAQVRARMWKRCALYEEGVTKIL